MNTANAFALYAFCMPFGRSRAILEGIYLAPRCSTRRFVLAPRLDMAEAKGAQMVKHKSIFSHDRTQ